MAKQPLQNSRLGPLGLGLLLFFFLGPIAAPSSNWAPPNRSAPADVALEQENPAEDVSGLPLKSTRRSIHELARLGVERWHEAGYAGRGIKIAILDSGFRGYRSYLGKELPSHVRVRTFRADGDLEARNSQHGIICAEVIHRIAPEADLLFANWDQDQPEGFLDAVRWARSLGARVFSCSLIMPSWSDGEGGGQIHATLSQLLGNGLSAESSLCFASAGNLAQRHWCGAYRAGPDGYQEWQAGQTANTLTPWSNEHVSAELYWSADADYEIRVTDRATGAEVGVSTSRCGESRHAAVVGFEPNPDHRYLVRVRQTRGLAGRFHLAALSSNLQYSTISGSVAFPADGPEVVAVGAVDDEGRREDYSSCGPNSVQLKPDIVAPVPFVTALRARPFGGTSAAAPQAAALAGLWWSRHPDWSAGRVRASIIETAHDLGPRGHNWETGYGCVRLP